MRRVAVLSDIHGNLPALEAVLADVERAGVDLIVLNGDLADGPFPAETLDRLAALGGRAVWLRGNGDRWLAEAREGRFSHPDPATHALIAWASARVGAEHWERLRHLPTTHTLELPGLGEVGICHATPRSDNEMFLVDSALDHHRAAFASMGAATIVAGHSHMPFDRLFDRRRMVNTGSVGMPYGHSGASWALLGPDIVLRRTRYDLDQAAARMLRSGMPGAEAFVGEYVHATPGDEEALAAFHETLRRQQEAGHFE